MVSAHDITVAVTVIGGTGERELLTWAGANPGDVVAIVGRLGWAAAGLAALGRGFRSPRVAVDAQRRPEKFYGQGIVAATAGATALIDVSDGLLADLGHIASASGVRIDLTSDAFDIATPVAAVAPPPTPTRSPSFWGEGPRARRHFSRGFRAHRLDGRGPGHRSRREHPGRARRRRRTHRRRRLGPVPLPLTGQVTRRAEGRR